MFDERCLHRQVIGTDPFRGVKNFRPKRPLFWDHIYCIRRTDETQLSKAFEKLAKLLYTLVTKNGFSSHRQVAFTEGRSICYDLFDIKYLLFWIRVKFFTLWFFSFHSSNCRRLPLAMATFMRSFVES